MNDSTFRLKDPNYFKALVLTNTPLLLIVLFLMVTGNIALFSRIIDIYPVTISNAPFILSLVIFFTILTTMFFIVICFGKATRWILALFVFLASQAAYYMGQFGVIVDTVMIDNIMQTNFQEFTGLLTVQLLLRTIFLGVIPAYLIIRYYPRDPQFYPSFRNKLVSLGILLVLLVTCIAPFTSGYFSFFREHKITRFYANPTYMTYSVINFLAEKIQTSKPFTLKLLAQDATILDAPQNKPELMIMVVGETARADRFSLNGYHRETNPLLAKQGVVSFTNVSSCGTSTGVSVPCMFSSLTRKEYDKEKALHQENALDILFDHGVEVLWRDNNSDSKGVATRVPYENFKTPTLNPECEGECRDIGMLHGLDDYIKAREGKEILIVLHQMGNHGPEYYRRYPKAFARFQPMCMTGELRDCDQNSVDNSYDNAILYTDYFLSNVIDFLKKYDETRATSMLYFADHGESLGENGFYLHAAPYGIAPKEQTHVPAIMWMGQHFDYTKAQLMPYQDTALSHDDLFCSLLINFEIDAKMCASKKAMLMENKDIKSMIANK